MSDSFMHAVFLRTCVLDTDPKLINALGFASRRGSHITYGDYMYSIDRMGSAYVHTVSLDITSLYLDKVSLRARRIASPRWRVHSIDVHKFVELRWLGDGRRSTSHERTFDEETKIKPSQRRLFRCTPQPRIIHIAGKHFASCRNTV